MPAALRITLTREENKTLQELEVADSVSRRTKQRATALRLNALGWKVSELANYLEWAESTVRQTIHRWKQNGLVGLWEAGGRGKKPIWTKEDWLALEQWLNEPRSISSRQLSQRLARERQVFLGAIANSSYTQKKKWRWKRLRRKPPAAKNLEFKEAKTRDLQLLKLWAKQGLITLLYLDESGCCPESPLSYGYGQIGQQKSISQRTRKGRRVNIMGVWEEEKRLEYALDCRNLQDN